MPGESTPSAARSLEPIGSDDPLERAETPLLPPGNALKWRGFAAAALGFALLTLALALRGHSPFTAVGVPLFVALSALGLLYGLGTFDDGGPVRASVRASELGRPFAAVLASGVALLFTLRGAVAGVLPRPVLTAAILVPLLALGLVAASFWFWHTVTGSPRRRGLLSREGFWLLALGIALYLPLLGSYSLIDPWETHYGEVAREMIARDDWISLWWAQENWFWSKPVLTFWLEGLAFIVFGVRWEPDQMLAGVSQGRLPAPEWAVRMPALVLSLFAVYAAYRALSRVRGRRAGFLGGLVLVSVPYWSLIAHQSMTDMPYVATLTIALCLVLLGLDTDADERVAIYEVRARGRTLRWSLANLMLGVLLATSLPQLAYLASRNVTVDFEAGPSISFHHDIFFSGSGAGNCGLPGNAICEPASATNPDFQPWLAALVWGVSLGALLWANRGERRKKRIYYLAAWYAVALSILAKGAPGAVLGVAIPLVAIGASRRFRELPRLELVGLGLITAAVALPWYVQAFVRHGAAFTDRLLFYDMYKRAFVHVHDTNAGDDVSFRYYLWQLGYGLFPFSGLAAIGFFSAFPRRDEAHDARALHSVYLGLWFVIAFAMFSVSLTKFHHYVLPAVPPLALLTGLALEGVRRSGSSRGLLAELYGSAGFALCAACLVLGVASLLPGSVWGSALPARPPQVLLGCSLVAAAGAAGVLGARYSSPSAAPGDRFEYAVEGLLLLLGAAAVALVGRDFFEGNAAEGQPQLLDLFSYNYTRAWPKTLDFRTPLHAFALSGTLLLALAVVPRLRHSAVSAFIALGPLFCAFGLDVYLPRVAPHWGQRENLLAYYAARSGPAEPLVAYQMNWKGENFYTGNRLPAFVTSGDPFKDFLREHRARHTRVLFFTTEHSRLSSLKSELGKVKSFRLLTRADENNKFFVARVEL
jgi:4-amino-4-deoxy-L-arabinose transferase-like glycosyltransferase